MRWPVRLAPLLLSGLFLSCPAGELRAEDEPWFAQKRSELVAWVTIETALAKDEIGIDRLDPALLQVLGEVPRHRFVPEPLRSYSYLPYPLPVHPEQNLAAPFIAALMLQLARLQPGDVVFETGTDTGYGAALLSRLVRQVYSIELIPELARSAAATLAELGYANVEVREGDGYFGWPEHAPYDAIIVKEQVDHVPGPLLAQLKPGGRLVLPLGGRDRQELTVIEKGGDGHLTERHTLKVRFSPLQGGQRT